MSSQLSSRRDLQIVRILSLLDGISYFPHGKSEMLRRKSEMLRGVWHFPRGKREMPHGIWHFPRGKSEIAARNSQFPRGKSEILRRILDFLRRKGEIPIRLSNLEFSGSKVPFACVSTRCPISEIRRRNCYM